MCHLLRYGYGENSDFGPIACREGEMDLTRGRLNLSGKANDESNTKLRKLIRLENNYPRP
jgi:hypothetical protein